MAHKLRELETPHTLNTPAEDVLNLVRTHNMLPFDVNDLILSGIYRHPIVYNGCTILQNLIWNMVHKGNDAWHGIENDTQGPNNHCESPPPHP